MSCILENSDLQFDSLKDDRKKYIIEMSGKAAENGKFETSPDEELNLDSLQAFLDFYFPDRIRTLKHIPKFFDEIINYNQKSTNNISIKTMIDAFNESKDCLAESDFGIQKNQICQKMK